MGLRHVSHLIVISSIVVHAADLGSASFLSDDLLSSNTNALAFNQPDSSLDLFSSSSNALQLPIEDTKNSDLFSNNDVRLENTDDSDPLLIINADFDELGNNDLFSIPNNAGLDDGSVELAACASSNASPNIGLSRIRRRDASLCIDPQTGSFKSQDTPADTAVGGQSSEETSGLRALHTVFTGKKYVEKQNEGCMKATAGVFPWGVCYQPTEVPLEFVGDSLVFPPSYMRPDPKGTLIQSFIVDPCSLSKSKFRAKMPWSIC